MMTSEQNREIVDYLFTKKLPLDLLVEVEDHMKEQISVEMENGKAFDEAFAETQKLWAKDLRLITTYVFGKKVRTVLQIDATKQADRKKHLQAMKFFLPYFALTIGFLFINAEVSKWLIITANVLICGYCAYIMATNYKIIKTGNNFYNNRNISFMQKKMPFVGISAQGLLFCVISINTIFERFVTSIQKMPVVTVGSAFSLLIPFIYVYCGLIGILYFIDYKKAVEILKQKINFKL